MYCLHEAKVPGNKYFDTTNIWHKNIKSSCTLAKKIDNCFVTKFLLYCNFPLTTELRIEPPV